MSGWTVDIATLAARANTDLDTVVRRATAQLWKAVVTKSPVLSGQFRDNWNASTGAPDTTTRIPAENGHGIREAARGASFAAGGVTYLSNGLPYGRRLEYEGWSKKSPNGMVRISVIEFANMVKNVAAAKT